MLLFLISGSSSAEPESPKDEENPACVAETVFRDFVCRASYGNINAVIKPVLTFVLNDFNVHRSYYSVARLLSK